MLASFRNFAKTPFATGIFVLAMLGFLVVGGRSFVGGIGAAPNAVVKAGDHTISADDFRQIFERVLQGQAQRGGQAPSVQEAVAANLDGRLLDEMAQEEALAAWISRIGVRPSDQQVAAELRKLPQFFNPVSGAFDKQGYEQTLAQNGLTPKRFERDLRDQIAQAQVLSGLAAGLRAPAAYAALQAVFNKETRQVGFVVLPVTSVPPPAKPTDAQMQAYLAEHAAQLQKPAMRQVSLVRFSASLLAPTVQVSDADLHKRFDAEKDTLSTPEKRTFAQIAVTSAAQAQAVLARLKAGADPVAAAKAAGAAAPTPYADTPKTAVPDGKLADAVFAMAPGSAQVVQGSLGLSVVKLTGVTPGHQATFEEARPKLEAEIRQNLAAAKANTQMQAYDQARNGGSDFAQAAQRAGAATTVVPAFDAQGRSLQGQPLPVPAKLVQTAFSLQPGATSDILDAAPGKGEYYAIRVDKVIPAGPYTLDEVREPLARQMTIQAISKALHDKADALADRLKKGESLAAVAAAAGQAPQQAALTRDDQAGLAQYGEQFFAMAFGAKPGEAGVAPYPKGNGFAVFKLDAVRQAPPAEVARAAQLVQRQATPALAQDLAAHARTAAVAVIRPKTNAALARKALGVDAPPPAAGAAGGAAPPAK
ncbi:MAG: peptidyl-prolyl cis-trans isomerase [Caulobacteraceae bacterium]|nr:peptidyl-prolyl cis-trans isomerase [Caulobacter sp.]